jgi:outer membrane immunogenic protein
MLVSTEQAERGFGKMTKAFIGTACLMVAGFAAPAAAADIAAQPSDKAPTIIKSVYDWGGFYGGLNAGAGSSHQCLNITVFSFLGTPINVPSTSEGCNTATGAIVGGQAGFRVQNNALVFGLEAQGSWANLRGSSTSLPAALGAGVTNQTRLDGLGLFTGQVGFALNNVLWYVSGGAAVTSSRYVGLSTATGASFDQGSDVRYGASVGTGIEYGFAPNWSAGIEYDHLFLGSQTITFNSTNPLTPGALSRVDTVRQDLDMVTARINYRWGGPLISKY